MLLYCVCFSPYERFTVHRVIYQKNKKENSQSGRAEREFSVFLGRPRIERQKRRVCVGFRHYKNVCGNFNEYFLLRLMSRRFSELCINALFLFQFSNDGPNGESMCLQGPDCFMVSALRHFPAGCLQLNMSILKHRALKLFRVKMFL